MTRPTLAIATEATAAQVARLFARPESLTMWPGLETATLEVALAVANAVPRRMMILDELAEDDALGALLVAAQDVVNFGSVRATREAPTVGAS